MAFITTTKRDRDETNGKPHSSAQRLIYGSHQRPLTSEAYRRLRHQYLEGYQSDKSHCRKETEENLWVGSATSGSRAERSHY